MLELIKLTIFSALLSAANGDSLKALFVVSRHGDRSPLFYYANDPYKSAHHQNYPEGFNQLTNAGKVKMFNTGLFLRHNYKNLLSDNYHEAYARSSDKDRCIESAQLVLNGVYKPENKWIWNKDALFQAVPVHTVPSHSDPMLEPTSSCPAAEEEQEKIFNSLYVKELNRKNQELIGYVQRCSGSELRLFNETTLIYDTLHTESNSNLRLPEWATSNVMDQLKQLDVHYFRLLSGTKKLQKFRSGVLLYDISKRIEEIIKNLDENDEVDFHSIHSKKLNLYLTHDKVIYNLLSGLQINDYQLPTFGQTIIIELHKYSDLESNWSEASSVRILLLNETQPNGTPKEPYLLKVPACLDKDVCTVRQFLSAIADLAISPEEWTDQCNVAHFSIGNLNLRLTIRNLSAHDQDHSLFQATVVIIFVLVILVLILCVSLIVLKSRERRNPGRHV